MLSVLSPSGTNPDFGTRPNVGFKPLTPLWAAGQRILPPVSVPSPAKKSPAATPDPVSELYPPGHLFRSQGFLGSGNGFVGSGMPNANSIVVVLPTMIAPASRSRLTTGASLSAPHSGSSTRLWAVVGASLVAMMSFIATGIPCRGPRLVPSAVSLSAAFA